MASVPDYKDVYRISTLVNAGWRWSESDSDGGWTHPLVDPIVTDDYYRRGRDRTRCLDEAWFIHESDNYDRPASVTLATPAPKGGER